MTAPELPEAVVHPLALQLQQLGERTARQVLQLLDQLDAGLLDPGQLPELAAVLVKLGADQAAALTLGELVRELADAGAPAGALPPVAGVTGHATLSGAELAAGTVMAGPVEERRARLERLARGAVARAGQDSREQAIARSPLVEGWTRGLDSTACQLCRWWWREGRVWPKRHHMPRHPGCTCVQVPELTRELRDVSREAADDSAERRQLAARGEYLAAFGTGRRHNG